MPFPSHKNLIGINQTLQYQSVTTSLSNEMEGHKKLNPQVTYYTFRSTEFQEKGLNFVDGVLHVAAFSKVIPDMVLTQFKFILANGPSTLKTSWCHWVNKIVDDYIILKSLRYVITQNMKTMCI